MRIRSLIGTTDNNIQLLSCHFYDILVKIEIVARSKTKPQAVNIHRINAFVILCVIGVNSWIIKLRRCGMRFEIQPYFLTRSIYYVRGVAISFVRFITVICKHERVTPLCRFFCLFIYYRTVFFNSFNKCFPIGSA